MIVFNFWPTFFSIFRAKYFVFTHEIVNIAKDFPAHTVFKVYHEIHFQFFDNHQTINNHLF